MNYGIFGWSLDDYKLIMQLSGIALIIFMLIYIGISARDIGAEE
jgi:hypothetical protein